MAQWLRSLVALSEAEDMVHSTHSRSLLSGSKVPVDIALSGGRCPNCNKFIHGDKTHIIKIKWIFKIIKYKHSTRNKHIN